MFREFAFSHFINLSLSLSLIIIIDGRISSIINLSGYFKVIF